MIGLVNLCTYEDISKRSSFQKDIDVFVKNEVSFVDYASGRDSKENLLRGFYEAIENPEISTILFTNGGSKLIEYLEIIDWDRVVKSKKSFAGLSDFTHFSVIANNYGLDCYYGVSLKNISKYWSEDLQKKITHSLNRISIGGETDHIFSIDGGSITGGHLPSVVFMIQKYQIDLKDKHLFIEHHYIPGESLDDLTYYLNQLVLVIKENKPKSLILGHTSLYEGGKAIPFEDINKHIKRVILSNIDIDISSVDHFEKIIKFGYKN